LRNRYSVVCITNIDGLMPPNLVNMVAVIYFSACGVFAQHSSSDKRNRKALRSALAHSSEPACNQCAESGRDTSNRVTSAIFVPPEPNPRHETRGPSPPGCQKIERSRGPTDDSPFAPVARNRSAGAQPRLGNNLLRLPIRANLKMRTGRQNRPEMFLDSVSAFQSAN